MIHFLPAKLAPFVRECRKQIDGVQQIDRDVDWLEADNSWVLKMPLSMHHSVACYIRLGKDAADINKLDKVFARCTTGWRYDFPLCEWHSKFIQRCQITLSQRAQPSMWNSDPFLGAGLSVLILKQLGSYKEARLRRYFSHLILTNQHKKRVFVPQDVWAQIAPRPCFLAGNSIQTHALIL